MDHETNRDEQTNGRSGQARSVEEPLTLYLRSISKIPVLRRDQQLELAAELAGERKAFLDRAFSLQPVARAIVDRWRDRKRAGRSTGPLSSRYLDGSGREPERRLDRALAVVEDALEGAGPQTEETNQVTIRNALEHADLSFELVVDCFRSAARDLTADAAVRGSVPAILLEEARTLLARHDRLKRDFIEHNLKLVVRFAKRYASMGVPLPDLIQEGNIGLIRAVEKYDHSLGHAFSTYASFWIEQAIIRGIQRQSRVVRVPSHVYQQQLQYRRAEAALRVHSEEEPGSAEIAQSLGIAIDEMDRLQSTMTPVASTDTPVAGTENLTLADALEDEHSEGAEAVAERHRAQCVVPGLLEILDGRERFVLERRFGLGDHAELTLEAVGKELGLSREGVRQIEVRALQRLRGSEFGQAIDREREAA